MTQTFICRNTTSDLTGGGGVADYSLLSVTFTSATVSVGGNPTGYVSYFTGSGVPGTNGATGNYTIEVNVTTANSNVEVYVQLHRVNSSGTIQTSSSTSTPQSGATTGVKTFSYTSLSLGTWAAGDRLRLDVYGNRVAGHGQQDVVTTINTTDSQVVTPFTPPPITQNVNQVTETDLAQAISRVTSVAVGLVTETDTAQVVTSMKSKQVQPPGWPTWWNG